jgi:hypothetical protein
MASMLGPPATTWAAAIEQAISACITPLRAKIERLIRKTNEQDSKITDLETLAQLAADTHAQRNVIVAIAITEVQGQLDRLDDVLNGHLANLKRLAIDFNASKDRAGRQENRGGTVPKLPSLKAKVGVPIPSSLAFRPGLSEV